jgi:PleD family two-component response regulator
MERAISDGASTGPTQTAGMRKSTSGSTRDALRITNGIRGAVRRLTIPHEGSSIEGCEFVTVSAGIATLIPDRDAVPEEVIRLADESLYAAKRGGRDRVMG